MRNPIEFFKYGLTKLGEFTPKAIIFQLNSVLNYLETGRFLKEAGLLPSQRLKSKLDVFREALHSCHDKHVAYLEFGVYQGQSMAFWSKELTHAHSSLHGFDSFEGLPEEWNHATGKGAFSLGGNIPQFADTRVKLFKGWFDETLREYQIPDHEVLFVNVDSDLYSSAKLVLAFVRAKLRAGDFIYFDEFADRNHELKAFAEFLTESGLRLECLAANKNLQNILFRVTTVASFSARPDVRATVPGTVKEVADSPSSFKLSTAKNSESTG